MPDPEPSMLKCQSTGSIPALEKLSCPNASTQNELEPSASHSKKISPHILQKDQPPSCTMKNKPRLQRSIRTSRLMKNENENHSPKQNTSRNDNFLAGDNPSFLHNCHFEDRNQAERFHSFVQDRTVKELQQISKVWKLKVRNKSKSELVSKMMLHVYIQTQNGTYFTCLFNRNKELNSYYRWEKDAMEGFRTWWDVLPEIFSLIQNVADSERAIIKRNSFRSIRNISIVNGDRQGASKPDFCLNEFARLIVLLQDDERCRYALLKACGEELSRVELEARVSRERFWTLIETRFNNEHVDSLECFKGYLDEVDSNQRASFHRTASVLKNQFLQVRRSFTKVKDKWVASGQSDPKRINRFLQMTAAGDLTMDSKRVLVFFIVCKVGTPEEDVDLLRAASKLIEDGEGGREEGVTEIDQEDDKYNAIGRKRRSSGRKSDDDKSILSQRMDSYQKIMKESLEIQKAQHSTTTEKNNRITEQAEEEAKMLDIAIQSAQRCKKALEFDDEIQEFGRILLERNMKRFKKYYDSSIDGEIATRFIEPKGDD